MSETSVEALQHRLQGINKHITLLEEKIKPDLIQYVRLTKERDKVDRQISNREVNKS